MRGSPAAFSPDGSQVALQADLRLARLLDTASGRELAHLTPAMPVSGSLAWSHSRRRLATATENGTCLWDLPLLRARLRELGLEAAF